MDWLLQQLINGLALGSIYALIALGYTMVYGVLRFINFAHADVLMLGLLETFAGGISGLSNYRDGIAFAILILILLFKPAGLLGKASVEKV